jgi:hypothetical protein
MHHGLPVGCPYLQGGSLLSLQKKDFIVPAWGPDNEVNMKKSIPSFTYALVMPYFRRFLNAKKQSVK